MDNEVSLFNLYHISNESSLLVAQDLAIEMSCGLPIVIKSSAFIDGQRSMVGYHREICNVELYDFRKRNKGYSIVGMRPGQGFSLAGNYSQWQSF